MQNHNRPPQYDRYGRPVVSTTRRPSGHTQRPGTPRPGSSPSRARPASASSTRARPASGGRRVRPASQSRRPVRQYRPATGTQPLYRPRQAPKKQRSPRFYLIAAAVLVVVIAIAAYIFHFISVVGIGEPKFINHVSVNGHSFAGYTKEEGMAAAAALEDEWLNDVYTLQYQNYSYSFSRAMVNADSNYEEQLELVWNLGQVGSAFERKARIEAFAQNPYDFPVSVTYDEALLGDFIDQISADINKPSVDAVVVADMNEPVVLTESQTGLEVNQPQLREQLVALITGNGEVDTAIPVDTLFPTINSDAVSFQVIGYFTTDTSFRGSGSLSNVRLALNAFNGLTVMPGQRISFNEIVGPRTEAAGFQKATEFAGDTTTIDWGGGVCQASTTLYNALIMADMDIIDRNRHSMTVSYVDPSCDAAVVYGEKDLVFENNTPHSIYIYTSVTSEKATVTIYGHRPEYFYRLESVVIEENLPSTRVVYVDDPTGEHVMYKTDPPVIHTPGQPGCITQGWIVAYDWETQEEVSRVQVTNDHYQPSATVYYQGIHDPVGVITDY